ncbi:hypothetical protein DPQ33_17425 [Oceanidesulfovibrio indonesiensis]|uniref:Tyr recombinase domain-containing protein n=1 Tax=Oceanidesulfovibrio indonesiensis TaxID=54767 RepID=A0A7M3MA69_9BACT|nr:hypothetical protein DPQ33_17425 [Oceanidesulfovibrio indonesiensis]
MSTRKTRGSALRRDWLPILPELHEALEWWHSHRPYRGDNVFMMLDDTIHCYHQPGAPYKHRQKFMARLCKRAGIERPFGFQAIRHRRAVDLYKQGPRLRDIQLWLRHESAATTERSLKG